MDLPGQVGVGLEFQLLCDEIVIGLGLLEGGLPVLPDHDECGQEDRLQGHDQRQGRPRTWDSKKSIQTANGAMWK